MSTRSLNHVAALIALGLSGMPGVAHGQGTDTLTLAAVSAGGIHTCAVTTAGAAYCWGNARGQVAR